MQRTGMAKTKSRVVVPVEERTLGSVSDIIVTITPPENAPTKTQQKFPEVTLRYLREFFALKLPVIQHQLSQWSPSSSHGNSLRCGRREIVRQTDVRQRKLLYVIGNAQLFSCLCSSRTTNPAPLPSLHNRGR